MYFPVCLSYLKLAGGAIKGKIWYAQMALVMITEVTLEVQESKPCVRHMR